jgi:carboxyl-terminal processing protease
VKPFLNVVLLLGALALAPITDFLPAYAADAQVAPGERRSALDLVATADDLILLERAERGGPPVEADPDEAAIARLTARLLPGQHYRRQEFDATVSSRFLDRYLRSLDNLHLHFLQSDLDEFEAYRDRLHEYTLQGNTDPGRRIFERFLLRVEQRVAWVGELLKTERFEFTEDESYRLDRDQAPRPKDLEEARALWRQHLRFEILQEILGNTATPAVAAHLETDPTEAPQPDLASEARPNGLTAEVEKTLTRRYARLLRTLKDFEASEVFQLYLSALTHVYDPHSDYIDRRQLENFAINMNLSLFGIGAVLQSVDGYCKVRELRPGPAMRSKQIQPGDRIVAVAQGDDPEAVDVVDMKLTRIVELIRGPKGSTVRLTLIPVDATDPSVRREVTLVRDEIRLEDEEAKAKIIELPNAEGRNTRIGVIDLPSFYGSLNLGTRSGRGRTKSTTVDVAQLLSKLKQENVEGIILDLRRNGGGSLEEAIDLTGLFIQRGPVVQVRDARHQVFVHMDPSDDKFYDGPLVVLTSRFSASASEILAGCLQDYGRALIVGDSSTHGKGTVQSLIELRPMLAQVSEPGALKVTIRKFYRASGGSTQLKGIQPDIVLPSVNNVRDIGEASLDDPLPWNTISAARFEPENRVEPILGELLSRSQQRIAACPEFGFIHEDIERYLQQKAEPLVSLNLKTRLEEKAENEARLEARKQERLARPAPTQTVYELTLKDVDRPGLPPPVDPARNGSHSAVSEEDDPAEATADSQPGVDATLEEAKQIVLDLIELSGSSVELARGQQSLIQQN